MQLLTLDISPNIHLQLYLILGALRLRTCY
jgi:hypothetical protein